MNPPPEGNEARKGRNRSRAPIRGSTSLEDLGRIARRPRGNRARRRRQLGGPAVLVAVLVLLLIGGGAFASYLHGHSDLSAATPPKPAGYAFVFVLQGIAPTDLAGASVPNISALASHGTSYSNGWVGHLETTPVSSNATIGTGLYPRNHGVLGREWGSAHNGGVEVPTTNTQVQLGSLDQLMQNHARDSLAGRIKNRFPGDRIVSVSGNNCGTADAAGTWAADYILCARRDRFTWLPGSVTGHAPPTTFTGPTSSSPVAVGGSLAARAEGWRLGQQDAWIARYAENEVIHVRPRLTIVTFPEVEAVVRLAPAAQRRRLVRELLHGIDAGIGRIEGATQRLHIFDQSVFLVTSDQALAPINRRVRSVRLDQTVTSGGGQIVYVNADMSAMIGLRDRLQIPPVSSSLRTFAPGHVDAIFSKTTNRTSDQYRGRFLRADLSPGYRRVITRLVASMAAPGSPDVVLVYAPFVGTGYLRDGPFLQSSGGLGAQWPNQHIPMILSGRGVVEGRSSGYPAQLIDVAPTIEALLGLHSVGDGIVLSDAMYLPPAGSIAKQQVADRDRTPLVGALQRRLNLSDF